MINKKIKNALYAQILIESSDLIFDLENELKNNYNDINKNKGNNKCTQKNIELKEINIISKASLINLHRIKNNALIMLLRGGNFFYTKSGSWKDSKDIYLKINQTDFILDLQTVKSLLSNDCDNILDKCYSTVEINNEIELSEINKINFDNYTNVALEKMAYDIEKGGMAVDKKTEYLNAQEVKQHRKKTDGINKSIVGNVFNQGTIDKKAVFQGVDANLFGEKVNQNEDKNGELRGLKKVNNSDSKQNVLAINNNKALKETINDINIPIHKQSEIKIENLRTKENVKPIDDEINIHGVMPLSVKGEADLESFTVNDLVFDIYTILFEKKENTDDKKNFTIIVAPADINRECYSSFAPSFAFAKTGKTVCTCSSPNKLRSSYQIMLENETFVIRGKWSNEEFTSLVYPLNANNKEVIIQQKHIRPIKSNALGHVLEELENGIKLHILPLSSTNTTNNNVVILVCLEDVVQDKYLCFSSKDQPYVELLYNMVTYKISAKWANKKLIPTIELI